MASAVASKEKIKVWLGNGPLRNSRIYRLWGVAAVADPLELNAARRRDRESPFGT